MQKKKSKLKKRPTKAPLNSPQAEVLLNEKAFGDQLALIIDEISIYDEYSSERLLFFRRLIKQYNIKSACDLSCNNGNLLKMLGQLGINRKEMVGLHISDKMLRLAARKAGRAVQFIRSPIDAAPGKLRKRKFDLIVCSNDSLSAVLADEKLFKFFRKIRSSLSDNGIFLLEQPNYNRIWSNREKFSQIVTHKNRSNESIFFLDHDFQEELVIKNLVHIRKSAKECYLRAFGIPVRPLTQGEISFLAEEAQFSKLAFFGGLTPPTPYKRKESPILVMVAKK